MRTLTVSTLFVLLITPFVQAESPVKYPETHRVDHVDVLHGVKVPDPYRWLEDDVRESDDVAKWVEQQNEVTFGYLKQISERAYIRERMTELWNFEKFQTPFKRGGRYYYYHNSGLQNQYVLYTMDSLDSEPTVLIDPNKWSEDGTVALSGTVFSDDGRYVTYGVQNAGSDWRIWKVMEVETGKILEDELNWIKFNSPAWTKDGKGFFYARYPQPDEDAEFQALNLNMKVYYHRIGTSQDDDVLVYERPDEPSWGYGCDVTEDGRYLVMTVWKGTDDRYRIVYRDLNEPYGLPTDLITSFENEYTLVGSIDSVFYFKTDLDAPNRRVLAIDINNPERDAWKEIIAERDEALGGAGIVGNRFVARYLKDAKTQVNIHSLDGKFIREVEFPGIGSATGFGGKQDESETFYSFASFATPPTIYRYDMESGESTLSRQAEVKFNPDDYETKQVFYKSKDGTQVPMFIVHRKGLKLDGSNPTLLYGYGGFNISLAPRFSITRLTWMDLGGVFVSANLRGGGEYGKTWHKAGTKLQKQNVFDDFIAAAEWLIDNGYTSKQKLAIQGGSNGGLLVGACMTQRPDLYGACLPAVGVMDMLRFHKFTAGRFWVDDYGSADNADEFKALHAYSPYHNLKDGVSYPPTLVTTADTDDRVVPGHSFKFAARLQEAHKGKSPVMIRIETKAGHGAGKPTSKIIEEYTDEWAFLVRNLGMTIRKNDE